MLSRVFLRLGAILCGVLAVEGILFLLTSDGTLLGEPLPPYAAVNTERQADWVGRLRSDEPFKLARFDAELGWEWKPGAANDDGSIHLNAWGARGEREYPAVAPAGTTRLLFFGDSYTFCDEMPDDSSFEAYLELRRPELEAVNFGVNGYGTDQALLRYRRLGRDKGARVVFIGILIENIGRNANRLRPLWNPKSGFAFPKPRFVLRDGQLAVLPQPYADRAALVAAFDDGSLLDSIAADEHWLTQPDLGVWAWSRAARMIALPLAHRARDPLALWNDADGQPRRVTLAILEQFQNEALADGAERAPILVFPSREDLAEMQATGLERWNAVGDVLRAQGLEFIDLAPALLERKLKLDADPSLGTLHFRGHHSSVGNDVVALEIERWLVEQRIL